MSMNRPPIIWLLLAFSVGINVLVGSHHFVKSRLNDIETPNLETHRPQNTKFTFALDARVKLRRYIVFSLFDSSEFHITGAIRNLELAPLIYPGAVTFPLYFINLRRNPDQFIQILGFMNKDWVVRFYINASVPLMYIEQFRALGAEIIDISAEPGLGLVDARLWRFLVADEADLDIFIDREVHSRLSIREKCAVEEWIKSQSSLHCMRDHPSHLDSIIPGMFGMKNTWRFRNYTSFGITEFNSRPMRDLLVAFSKSGRIRAEDFLDAVLWPEMQSSQDFMCHDAFNCMDPRFVGSTSFPCPRRWGEFVGQKMKGFNDKPTTPLRLSSNPPECRRNPEWQVG